MRLLCCCPLNRGCPLNTGLTVTLKLNLISQFLVPNDRKIFAQ